MEEISNGTTADNIPEKVPFFNDPAKRSMMFQLGIMLILVFLGYYLIANTMHNLERQAIATGLGFLAKESSFEIGESLISYSAADTYGRALIVGFINTLIVSFIGIVLNPNVECPRNSFPYTSE